MAVSNLQIHSQTVTKSFKESYILKISGTCNLACLYCRYYQHKQCHHLKDILSLNILDNLLREMSSLTKRIHLIWHGGEPLIAGKEYFRDYLILQKKIENNYGLIVKNSIQTNATLVTKEWAKLLKQANFGVGVSLDGPKWLHNKTRRYPSGAGSYDQTMRGIEILRSENIDISVLSVLSKLSLNHAGEIFDFFINNDIRYFDFLPLFDFSSDAASTLSISSGDFGRFIISIFDLWFSKDDPNIIIRYIDQAIISILRGKVSLCKMSNNCHEYLTINFNGDVLPCDSYYENNSLVFGNLNSSDIKAILLDRKTITFMKQIRKKRRDCLLCAYYKYCKGGCPRYNTVSVENESSNYLCIDTKMIFTHIIKVIKKEHPLLAKEISLNDPNKGKGIA